MTRYDILLTGCIATKITTSIINRYTEENERGEKSTTIGKVVDDIDSIATVGLVGLGLIRIYPKLF